MLTLAMLAITVRMATPILLAGLGALYNDRAGVTNITLEGSMLISAFAAVTCSYFTRSWQLSVFAAVLTGIAIALVFFFVTMILGGDELVVGFAMNVLLDGLAIFLLKQIFNTSGSILSDRIVGVPLVQSDFIKGIPILGVLFNGQTWIVYFALLSVILTYIVLNRTAFGLKILSCGEKPEAAATVGINVINVRFICNVISGAFCGLAGVQISLGFLSLFTVGMTAGRGFIALGSVIFSRGNPLRLLAITMFFGFADAVSNQMQMLKLPSELVLMIPYLAVVILTMLRFDQIKKSGLHRLKQQQ